MALSRHSANSVFNLEEIGEKNFFFQIGHINQWLFCLIHFSKSSMQKWKIHFFVVLIIPLYNNSFLNELFKWITTSDVQFDFLHATYLKPVLIVKYSIRHHTYTVGVRKPAHNSHVSARLVQMTYLC